MSKQSSRPLIIVESPTKARTILRFMKSKYNVKASMGHVRDLPKSKLGVDIKDGFKPQYITIRGKGNVIKELRDAAKQASGVYLATDPDREGELYRGTYAMCLALIPKKHKG